MSTRLTKKYKVGSCPACHAELYVEAVIDLEGTGHDTAPDPRAEGKVSLTGKISGAQTVNHDCRKRVTR